MIQIPPQASLFVMHEPLSFHKGIDGMAGVARVVLQKEPMSGALFVLRNRRRQMLRVLFFDGGGFWLSLLCVITPPPSCGAPSGRDCASAHIGSTRCEGAAW